MKMSVQDKNNKRKVYIICKALNKYGKLIICLALLSINQIFGREIALYSDNHSVLDIYDNQKRSTVSRLLR